MKDIARELLKLAKELTAADELPSERELRKFYDYVMDFYGRSGLYPITKNGRPLHKRDVVKATWKMLKGRYEWGGGDSVDRERVRDIMLDAGYEWPEAPLKLAKELTAADEVTFLNEDDTYFSVVRDFDSAFALWEKGRWDFVVNGKRYKRNDWRGRQAIEELFDIISGDEGRKINETIGGLRAQAMRLNEDADDIEDAWKKHDRRWLKRNRVI